MTDNGDSLIEEMREILGRHANQSRTPMALEGLTLFKLHDSFRTFHTVYNPRLCVVLRGAKEVSLGDQTFAADESAFLIVTVDLPVLSKVFRASDGRSHLAFTIDLDRHLIVDVLQKLPLSVDVPEETPAGVIAAPMRPPMLGAFVRLLRLLDNSDDARFLRPLVLQEIYYQLVKMGLGSILAQFASAGTRLSQLGKATAWIKSNYRESMSVEELADLVGMSLSSFHRHFKAVTLMTPLQYRTQVRLQEARRMLLTERISAGQVAAAVGYDSQSQFSRDYKRMFGSPPFHDAAKLLRAG